MKKIFTLGILMLFISGAFAQSFSDDFESYNDGDKIAASSSTWTTWSGGTAAEDAPVVTEQAHSGTKSLRIMGVGPDGGPNDIILPFGGKYTSGEFNFHMSVYIESGKAAYFNFQAETTPGQTWTEDFYFFEQGVFAGNKMPFVKSYNHDEWVQLSFNIDLTHNIWRVFLNGSLIGSYEHPINSVASIDLFPIDATYKFYVDDVSFDYSPDAPVLPALNANLISANLEATYIAGVEVPVVLNVRNLGQDIIQSVGVIVNGDPTPVEVTGLNIESLATAEIPMNTVTIQSGTNVYSYEIVSVNGGTDSLAEDNKWQKNVTGVVAAPHRKVLIEEGTGTWCGWCPRGAVFMDQMAEKYPDYFVGVAVHSGDPMEVQGYPGGIGFSSFPSMSKERTEIFGFGSLDDVASKFFERLVMETPAEVHSGASLNGSTLTVTAQADFITDATQQYKLGVILSEDEVTGTGSGYAQSNYYAGGSNGPMGGYENLPSVVPASQMVYNHVGRALISPFEGAPGSLPADAQAGNAYTFQMPDFDIPSDFENDKLHVVTLLIAPNGEVVNANSQTLQEALDFVLDNKAVTIQPASFELSPNPASNYVDVSFALAKASEVHLDIINLLGQSIYSKDLGQRSGNNRIRLDLSQNQSGIYLIRLTSGEQQLTQKLILK